MNRLRRHVERLRIEVLIQPFVGCNDVFLNDIPAAIAQGKRTAICPGPPLSAFGGGVIRNNGSGSSGSESAKST